MSVSLPDPEVAFSMVVPAAMLMLLFSPPTLEKLALVAPATAAFRLMT
jgi:hypothetical protein